MDLKKWDDFYAIVKDHVTKQHVTVIFVHNSDAGDIAGDIVQFGTGYFCHAEWMIGLAVDGTIDTANANGHIVAQDKFERYKNAVVNGKTELTLGLLRSNSGNLMTMGQ